MRTIAALALAIAFTLTANAGSTFHPINCTTDACCFQTPAPNCCTTDSSPCGIR